MSLAQEGMQERLELNINEDDVVDGELLAWVDPELMMKIDEGQQQGGSRD